MARITLPYPTFTDGQTAFGSQVTSDFTTVANLVNGNIDTSNLSSTAGIVDTQLAQISTGGKVSGAALTSLTSVPAGAGVIPIANIDTGTTANKIVILTAAAKVPAVDGSLLTGVSPYLKYVWSAASGTATGAPTASSWTKYAPTNATGTEESDVGGYGTIASSVIVLTAGTYLVNAACNFYRSGNGKLRLRNTTGGSSLVIGLSQNVDVSAGGQSLLLGGRFTVAAAQNLELQYYISNADANGYGVAVSSAEVEVYGFIEFHKIG